MASNAKVSPPVSACHYNVSHRRILLPPKAPWRRRPFYFSTKAITKLPIEMLQEGKQPLAELDRLTKIIIGRKFKTAAARTAVVVLVVVVVVVVETNRLQ